MFKFQTEWDRVEKAFEHFSVEYDKTYPDESAFSEQHFQLEWEKLQITTPCRRCGVALDVPDVKDWFDSRKVLEPMFIPYRANGERTGQRPRFYSPSDVGLSGFCESCSHDLVPWFQRLQDVCEVMKAVNYLERSIRCQRNNNPVEKSKLLDNLGKCLSTPPSGF